MCLFVSHPSQSFAVSPATAAATQTSHLILSLLKLFPQLPGPACSPPPTPATPARSCNSGQGPGDLLTW